MVDKCSEENIPKLHTDVITCTFCSECEGILKRSVLDSDFYYILSTFKAYQTLALICNVPRYSQTAITVLP